MGGGCLQHLDVNLYFLIICHEMKVRLNLSLTSFLSIMEVIFTADNSVFTSQ